MLFAFLSSFSDIQAQEIQGKNYDLTISQGNYTELTNAYVFSTPSEIQPFYLVYLSDFNFNAFGVKLGFDSASTGGQGTLVSFEGYLAANMIPANDSIVSFHAFLCNNFKRRDETSSISISQEGTPGDQIIKCQWKNFGFVGHPASDFVNFQLWLHEKDNSISYHYGPMKITSKAAFKGAGGPVVGLSQANWPAFDHFYKSEYLAGSATAPNIAHPSYLTIAMDAVPTEGMVYTFKSQTLAEVKPFNASSVAVAFYPQPFTNTLRCNVSAAGMHTLVLYDLTGKERNRVSGERELQLNRNNLESGIYFYRLFDNNGIRATGRIIAE